MKLPETTRLSRMSKPSDSIMVTVTKKSYLKPVSVRRSHPIKLPITNAFEPYPKPESFDPILTQRVDVLHPDPDDRRTVMLETIDQHAFNSVCKLGKERQLNERFYNAYSRYYYGDAVNKEIYRKYIRDSLKQQMTEREKEKMKMMLDKQSESKEAVKRDQDDIQSDVMKNKARLEFLHQFRDMNKNLMEEVKERRKAEVMNEKVYEREVLKYNPINWSATLK